CTASFRFMIPPGWDKAILTFRAMRTLRAPTTNKKRPAYFNHNGLNLNQPAEKIYWWWGHGLCL
ncbi:MAG TPA: hypothetical protein PLE35_13755, partial [Lentisphaeria bacterium]|nr:hypothetical protein [Lentisphaeria bacterium]